MEERDQTESFIGHVMEHQRELYAFILSMLPNLTEADDVLQETNMVLWRKREEFEPGTNFGAWARTVARFQVLAFLKRRKRDGLRFNDDLIAQIAGEAEGAADLIDRKRKALSSCMEKLRDQDRELIRQRYMSAVSVQDMADEAGRTANAVSQALHRIRRALLECIQTKMTLSGAES
ncbi:MAG: sigma-70 family RNA polymerase sigma factor [Phycisphaera sp.]|nr:sigma-70 family RNA polymerase sigma factor [Phycisphaera sp.]